MLGDLQVLRLRGDRDRSRRQKIFCVQIQFDSGPLRGIDRGVNQYFRYVADEVLGGTPGKVERANTCLLYTSPCRVSRRAAVSRAR